MKTKNANFLHILPFIFLYILYENRPERKELVCNDDRLYKYIPNFSDTKFYKQTVKYLIMSIPLVVLLMKTNPEAIEHTLVITSYTVAIKAIMHFLTPCIPKEEFSNIVFISTILNLIYFNVVPREKMTEAYLVSILYSVYLIAGRCTTSANIITDYTLAHFIFMYTKMF